MELHWCILFIWHTGCFLWFNLFYQIMTIFLIYCCFSFHPSFLGSCSSWMLTITCNIMDRAKIKKAIFWGFWLTVFSVNHSEMCLSLKTVSLVESVSYFWFSAPKRWNFKNFWRNFLVKKVNIKGRWTSHRKMISFLFSLIILCLITSTSCL